MAEKLIEIRNFFLTFMAHPISYFVTSLPETCAVMCVLQWLRLYPTMCNTMDLACQAPLSTGFSGQED